MEQVQKKGAAVEELGGNVSTLLSSSILNKFEKEFEKRGMLFTPELSEQLRKLIVESYNEIESSSPSPITEEIVTTRPIVEPSVEGTLPPLVLQFDWDCVIMGMMRNGKPEVVRNEIGSESTPPFAGFTDDNRLLYGTDAKTYCKSRGCLDDFLCTFRQVGRNRTVHLKEFGIFNLPALFFPALLIRKLKITAEGSQCNGEMGQCQAAILAVPMETTSANRLHLKEAALFAGFKDVYMVSTEGLAAYYWFHKNETERKPNNYSKDFVIVKFSDIAVVYKMTFESGIDRKKNLVVTPIVSLTFFTFGRCFKLKKEDELELLEVILAQWKLDQKAVIPVIGNYERLSWFSNRLLYLGGNSIKNLDEDDESYPSKYFAAKGAALLSENPENIGRQVRNMVEAIRIEPFNSELKVAITSRYQILPETFAQLTFTVKHAKTKYRIRQNNETAGYLIIHGVKFGLDLQVTYQLSCEGIWKVVGVSAKNPSGTDEGYKAVRWDWIIEDNMDAPQSGSSSYEECRSLLLKILPSPSQAKVGSTEDDSSGGLPPRTLDAAVEASASVCSSGDGNGKGKVLATKSRVTQPNDMNSSKDKLLKKVLPSTSQAQGTSAGMNKVDVTTAGLGNSQDQCERCGRGTIDIRDGNGTQEKKGLRKGRVISTTDIVMNAGLKNVKLESDWVEPVVKIEQDSVDGFGEDGNGQRINFQEHEIEIEEDVGKIEVEEEENITN